MDSTLPPDDPTRRLAKSTRDLATATVADVSHMNTQLRARLDKIEALLGLLTTRLLTGQPFRATDRAVLDFFGISDKNPDPLKLIVQRTAARQASVLGMVECPSCGSNVRDLEGVLEETCTFCGATVLTER